MNPFQSVESNNLDNIKKYINFKEVNLNLLDDQGKTLLDYAVSYKNFGIALLLKSAGAKLSHELLLISTAGKVDDSDKLRGLTKIINEGGVDSKQKDGQARRRIENSNGNFVSQRLSL